MFRLNNAPRAYPDRREALPSNPALFFPSLVVADFAVAVHDDDCHFLCTFVLSMDQGRRLPMELAQRNGMEL